METDCSLELENSETADSSETDDSSESEDVNVGEPVKNYNIVNKIFNRQMYGRFTRSPKGKTEKAYSSIPEHCCFNFTDIIPLNEDTGQQIFMGFSQCGRFLLSYCQEHSINGIDNTGFVFSPRYILHIWSFTPGQYAKHVAEHRLFRHYKNQVYDMDITICQWPTDFDKLVVYGTCQSNASEAYLTIITLPSLQKCKNCSAESSVRCEDTSTASPCLKHGVTIDTMLSIMPPFPTFRPNISLAYPDYVIINTGHYLYSLNISLDNNLSSTNHNIQLFDRIHKASSLVSLTTTSEVASFPDNVSDISESVSIKQELDIPNFTGNDIVSDISDCETEFSEYSKPFHELNISCEPLNVTGRSYWTAASCPAESSTTKTRVKLLLHKKELNADKSKETKSTIDNKIAEKAYEFTDEIEKCEKLSLFRKKRLADKKYEFSEDNCENIVPFNLLRHERRFCGVGRASSSGSTSIQSKNLLRSTNISPTDTGPFLSPRSSGVHSPRSPILSPNPRNGPFSPSSSSRNVYSRLVSPSPTNRMSPRNEMTQKCGIYSPSQIDSDFADDSKLVLRQINNISSPKVAEIQDSCRVERTNLSGNGSVNDGLLIVDEKAKAAGSSTKESFQWIKEVVRRYSAIDFESASSLVSDGQRDDNISMELPVLVHTKSLGDEHHLDVVPSHLMDNITGSGITLVHRTFDAEQFCHRTAKRICTEHDLKFIFCTDYDINIVDICPLSGDVICSAYIETGAVTKGRSHAASRIYYLRFMFLWGAAKLGGDYCQIIDTHVVPELRLASPRVPLTPAEIIRPLIQRNTLRKVRVMAHTPAGLYHSVKNLCDEDNLVSIVLDTDEDSDDYYNSY